MNLWERKSFNENTEKSSDFQVLVKECRVKYIGSNKASSPDNPEASSSFIHCAKLNDIYISKQSLKKLCKKQIQTLTRKITIIEIIFHLHVMLHKEFNTCCLIQSLHQILEEKTEIGFVTPTFVDEEPEAQKFKEIICTRSHTSLVAEYSHASFLGSSSRPGLQSTWSHLRCGPPQRVWQVWSHHRPVPLISTCYFQFLGELTASQGHGEQTNSLVRSPEIPLQMLVLIYPNICYHCPTGQLL